MIEVHLMDIIWHGHSCFELVSGGYSKINLFGEEMVTSCGVAARALAALAGAGIEIVLITTSDLDISLLIRQQDEDTALNALHKAFEV
jgi:aspartate kinase